MVFEYNAEQQKYVREQCVNVLPAPSEIEFTLYIKLITLFHLCDSLCVNKRCSRSCVYSVESAQHPGDETCVIEDYGESK